MERVLSLAQPLAPVRGLLKNKTIEQARGFQKDWSGATKESGETKCVYALEKRGIEKPAAINDRKPGDFLQLRRTNKSGHSVVFLDWVTDARRTIGVKYRST